MTFKHKTLLEKLETLKILLDDISKDLGMPCYENYDMYREEVNMNKQRMVDDMNSKIQKIREITNELKSKAELFKSM